jgi:hypothetical protein
VDRDPRRRGGGLGLRQALVRQEDGLSVGLDSGVALFWVVLWGFVFIDNLVLLPHGHDALRWGRSERLRYADGARVELLGRQLLFLNPLDPFDRIVITTCEGGVLRAAGYRVASRRLRAGHRTANRLSWLGAAYLALVLALTLASWWLPFVQVLIALAVVHFSAWAVACAIVVPQRTRLGSTGEATLKLLAEAVFVPAYTLDIAKRMCSRTRLDIPALGVGLRELDAPDEAATRARLAFTLTQRLDDLAARTDATRGELQPWLDEARTCLKDLMRSMES